MITNHSTLGLLGIAALLPSLAAAQTERPNFVWLMAEDVAPQFVGLYNDGRGAQLPNVERLAREGIVFENAYSNAPVSSAARSTLITGCYAPRLGISFHRKLQEVPMPEAMNMFPAYLRRAGYYTANAAKTDYNCFLDKEAWDQVRGKMGEWRNRPDKRQPFFFVRTNAVCHESCLHFSQKHMEQTPTFHAPDEVNLLPQHPDTELFRYTYATFYDNIRKVDNELGRMIDMLKEDGELDNTFIFFFGDNGGSLPGSKGYTGETGLRVPLVVYVPKNWRDKLPVGINSRADGLVSFMDLGPTLLHLAGVEVPEGMDGTPFLGEDIPLEKINSRDEVYGYGDRYDELYAFNRTVRKGNFKYSRNFTPYHPKSLFAFYRYKQLAFRQWKEMFEAGELNALQSRFFEPQGAEELYDLSKDPNETENLALRPEYRDRLEKMRALLFGHMIDSNDLGLLPECVWLTEGHDAPAAYGSKSHNRLKAALAAANLQLEEFRSVEKRVCKALSSSDPVIRYWALTACANWGEKAEAAVPRVRKLLDGEENPYVQSRALVFLSKVGEESCPVEAYKQLLAHARCGAESLAILNDMAYLKEQYPAWEWNLRESDIAVPCQASDWRMNYLNEK